MQKLFTFLIATVFFVLQSWAQNPASYQAHEYTTENGLPSNLIRGMQWDDNTGFLWIITEGGLVRFNGVDFYSYSKEKISPMAPEKSIYAVKNNAGSIFISDGSGNIFAVKKNKPVLWKPAWLSNSFINYYFIAVSDTFFNAKIKTDPAFSSPIEKIICLSDTSCLILYQNSIYLYSLHFKSPVELPLKKGQVSTVFKINNTCFLVDTDQQAYSINTNNFTLSAAGLKADDTELLNLNSGARKLFWKTGMMKPIIISANKAWAMDYSGGSITASLVTDIVPVDANISAVEYTEKNKLLFLGTESTGILVISQDLVLPKKRENANPKSKNAYFSQILLDDGNILTNEGDIVGKANSAPVSLPIKGKFSNRISYTDNSNLLWYNAQDAKSGENYFHQFNKTTGFTTTFEKIKLTTQVLETGSKTYLANNIGIGILQGDSIAYHYEYPKGIPNLNTYDFKEISPGILAVAGCSGLLRFNTSNNKLDTIHSTQNACYGSIWKYKDYIFWGSYGFGYFVYKNGVIKEMPVDKNGFLQYCHCFVLDDFGFCWISTNRGLFKVKIDEIIAHFENGITPIYYHYFGRKDGIEMTELNGGCTPCAIELKDKTLSFPTMDGLLWVNPLTAKPLLPEGNIYIDEILVDNKYVNPDSIKYVKLPSAIKEISIKLSYSAWCNKENIYIDYQLNDTMHWKKLIAADNDRIYFSNLPAGKYVLRIRKLNGFGIGNYSYKIVEFTIEKQWYNQWWLYLLIFCAIAAIVYLIAKIRTRQFERRQKNLEQQVDDKTNELQQKNIVLEKNNSINTRLISIISHDIITPLKFLNVAGKNLLEKKNLMNEDLKDETIKEITTTSKELQLLSTNILNWIKYQNENRRLAKEEFKLYDMVQQIFGILNSMANQKNLKLINSVKQDLVITQFYEPLKILVYNLITNAIHFSEEGKVIVDVEETDKNFIVSVEDEGEGMTAEQIKNILADQFIISSANVDNKKGNGLGYLIIKDLIKMMNAKIKISSEKRKGTKVFIELPK